MVGRLDFCPVPKDITRFLTKAQDGEGDGTAWSGDFWFNAFNLMQATAFREAEVVGDVYRMTLGEEGKGKARKFDRDGYMANIADWQQRHGVTLSDPLPGGKPVIPGLYRQDLAPPDKAVVHGKGWATGRKKPVLQKCGLWASDAVRRVEEYCTERKAAGKVFDISTRHVQRMCVRIAKAADVPQAVYYHPHLLRAYAITLYYCASGFNLIMTRTWARHEFSSTTERYIRALPDVQDEMLEYLSTFPAFRPPGVVRQMEAQNPHGGGRW